MTNSITLKTFNPALYSGAEFNVWSISIIIIGFIIFTFFLLYSKPLIAIIKAKQTAKRIQVIFKNDSFWNADKLEKASRKYLIYFYKQLSIENIEELKNFVTDNFHKKLYKKLEQNKEQNLHIQYNSINIRLAELTSIKDFINNDKDTFTVYFEGYWKRISTEINSGKTIRDNSISSKEFSIKADFIRVGNELKIDQIVESTSIRQLKSEISYIEND